MTPHDRYQRHIDLTGEIKQADQLIHECQVDVEAKQNALALAERALERQIGLRAEKHAEARRLAKEAYDDFMSLVPDETATMAVLQPGDDIDPTHTDLTTNVFASPLYTNGISRALEEAQNP